MTHPSIHRIGFWGCMSADDDGNNDALSKPKCINAYYSRISIYSLYYSIWRRESYSILLFQQLFNYQVPTTDKFGYKQFIQFTLFQTTSCEHFNCEESFLKRTNTNHRCLYLLQENMSVPNSAFIYNLFI